MDKVPKGWEREKVPNRLVWTQKVADKYHSKSIGLEIIVVASELQVIHIYPIENNYAIMGGGGKDIAKTHSMKEALKVSYKYMRGHPNG
jgi:hypothetical protein